MYLDNLNNLVGSGIKIYGSREKIRQNLVDFAKTYLELDTVDFYKTSVISYIIDVLSILSANHLFYDSMIYREFFMVEAQMQESVYNLARWIGYEVPKATASTLDVMFTIPLTFTSPDVVFTIPNNFKAYADDIVFTADSISTSVPSARFEYDKETYEAAGAMTGKIINNSSLSVSDSNGFYRPIYVQLYNNIKYASFTLPMTQHKRTIEQFTIPDTLQPYQFYSKKFEVDGMVSAVRMWLIEPAPGEKITIDNSQPDDFNPDDQLQSYINGGVGNLYQWTEWEESQQGIYTLSSTSKQFIFVGGENTCEIFFGNGIVGKQPLKNSAVAVELYVTRGTEGHITPNSITTGSKLYYTVTARYDENGNSITSESTTKLHSISYQIENPIHSQGGVDTPSLPEIKRNAIVNLRSKGKLVSESDYDDINTIMGSGFPTVQSYPILKRSDIKVNEIMAFILLKYHDESYKEQIVPTRNAKMHFDNPTFNEDGLFTVMRTSSIKIDDELYETLFNITMNNNTRVAYYDYIIKNVSGSPALMYNELDPSFYQQYSYMPINGVDFDVLIDEVVDVEDSSSGTIYDATHIYPLSVTVNVNHIPQDYDSDYYISDYRCTMTTKWDNNETYSQISANTNMAGLTSGESYKWFNFEIPNYVDIPSETQRFEFYIEAYAIRRSTTGAYIDSNGYTVTSASVSENPEEYLAWQPLSTYYTDVVIRKDLSDVMMSTMTVDSDYDTGTDIVERYYLHNVPVILSSYLDDGNNGGILNRTDNLTMSNFEATVMQALISNLDLTDKKMLTDYINIKFPDTYGRLTNLKYNPVETIVKSRFKTPFNYETPSDIDWVDDTSSSSSDINLMSGDKYIVNGIVPNYQANGKRLSSYLNYIAQYYDGYGWYLSKPSRGEYIKVEDELDDNEDIKTLIYSGSEWIDSQDFKIPLKIELKIEMESTATISSNALSTLIKSELMDHFSPYMGIHKHLDRSEIVAVVRQIPEVRFCEVLKPEVDIRFDYDIKDLTQAQLVDYTPNYVGFVDDMADGTVQDGGIQIDIVS